MQINFIHTSQAGCKCTAVSFSVKTVEVGKCWRLDNTWSQQLIWGVNSTSGLSRWYSWTQWLSAIVKTLKSGQLQQAILGIINIGLSPSTPVHQPCSYRYSQVHMDSIELWCNQSMNRSAYVRLMYSLDCRKLNNVGWTN